MSRLDILEQSGAGLGRVLAVSPHLDDAVFSCAALLERCDQPVVLTVFAGEPPDGDRLTSWDAGCGFASAHQAMDHRRHEDLEALGVLGAHPIHLGFLDAQYQRAPDIQDIQEAVQHVIAEEQPDTIIFPLGLFHSDHVLVHCAMMLLREMAPALRWIAYEDALYRRKQGWLDRRLEGLRSRGMRLMPFTVSANDPTSRKPSAVAAYRSQLRGTGLAMARSGADFTLRPDSDVSLPEGYWRLS